MRRGPRHSAVAGDGVVDCCDGADGPCGSAADGPAPRRAARRRTTRCHLRAEGAAARALGGRTISDAWWPVCREDPGALHPRPASGAAWSSARGRAAVARDARAFDAASRMWRHEGGDACPGTWLGAPPSWLSVAGCVKSDVGRLTELTGDLHTGAGPADYEILSVDEAYVRLPHPPRRRRAATRRARRARPAPHAVEEDGSPRVVACCSRGERGGGQAPRRDGARACRRVVLRRVFFSAIQRPVPPPHARPVPRRPTAPAPPLDAPPPAPSMAARAGP